MCGKAHDRHTISDKVTSGAGQLVHSGIRYIDMYVSQVRSAFFRRTALS